MELRNADGSPAEVSGNGVRCLAALLVERRASAGAPAGNDPLTIKTAGGVKVLTLLDAAPPRYTFRAHMGAPAGLTEEVLTVAGESVRAVILSVGNPQCVLLLPSVAEAERRLAQLGPALAAHERFPEGTNVELAVVERADRVRIVIWERGGRAHRRLGHRRMRIGGCRGPLRRGRPERGSGISRWSAVGGMERRRDPPDGLGATGGARRMDAGRTEDRPGRSVGCLIARGFTTGC